MRGEDEILKCTSRSGDVFTVVRAQEGTTAAPHDAGKDVRLNITAKHITDLNDIIALTDRSCAAYKSANQSIPNAAWTTLTFDLEEWDTDNIHDNATNNSRLTCQTAGKYLIFVGTTFADNTTGRRLTKIVKNASSELARVAGGVDPSGSWQKTITTVVDLAVADYVEILVYQSSGAALNILTAGTRFGMTRLL